MRQYSWLLEDIKNRSIEDVLILSGDQLYQMDYRRMRDTHVAAGADITVAVTPGVA